MKLTFLKNGSLLAVLTCAAAFASCRTTTPSGQLKSEDDSSGGVISILVIPPSTPLEWTSPQKLSKSSVRSKLQGELDKNLGLVTLPHPIGHLMVEMKCGAATIELTGQTGGGSEYSSALDGFGASFRTYPGALDVTAHIQPDVDARKKSGKIAAMNFKISGAMCKHMAGFLDEYKQKGAHKFYGGQFRPRRFEGAGCSAFGLAFVEIGGFIKRSMYTPTWAKTVVVGIGRVSDVLGTGKYAYGSNLQAPDSEGELIQWPKGKPMLVQKAAISPASPWLRDWYDERDASTNVSPNEQPNRIPWTIYDPESIFNFIKAVGEQGGGQAMGRTWTTRMEEKAVIIESDARDAQPVPYLDQEDDLRKDG